MSVTVVTRLRELVSANGVEVVRDHRRCEALVRDFCGSDIRECNLLLQGLREGIPGMLLEDIGRTPASQLVNRLVGKLTNNLGMTPEAARWVVVSWGFALGLMKQAVSPLAPVSQPNFSGTHPFSPANAALEPSVGNVPAGMTQNDALAISPGKASKKKSVVSGGGSAGVGSGKTANVFLFLYRTLGGLVAIGSLVLLIYSMNVNEKPNPDPVQIVVGLPGNSRGNDGALARGSGSGLGLKVEAEAEKSNLAMSNGKPESGKDDSDKGEKNDKGMRDSKKVGKQNENMEAEKKDSNGRNTIQKDWPKEITNSIGMRFVRIPKGKFIMGTPKSEQWHQINEVQHEVLITRDYYLGVTEVTQKQWVAIMGTNPSLFKGDKLPVENISWKLADTFCKKLCENTDEKKFNRIYRLPKESEWEYACRASTKSVFHFGDVLNGEQANCNGMFPVGTTKSGININATKDVGSYPPNNWGIYDMHGNVWEWCADWYGMFDKKSVIDPEGPSIGNRKVLRGGCWNTHARSCRSGGFRGHQPITFADHGIGFRVCLNAGF